MYSKLLLIRVPLVSSTWLLCLLIATIVIGQNDVGVLGPFNLAIVLIAVVVIEFFDLQDQNPETVTHYIDSV